ncbi:hypothetical protein [Achromobacter denitrificans]|uniref:Uncharacterized protein n=1 Tax=Achromobacter denitrificans TaxID=32002 RepID=A0A6N0JVN0_ACHDE|nr:hypothetical protein [Achromobacter denitrificans]MDF3851390.1 hypothetical protein [Achromobacter denitrificans]QKQ51037.1 hypothetical protein FOC81_31675 [Achromobacter denitrificans]QKQ51091.1 hypothetical protein FOC81_31985 [Achromobacter denitrificans]
MSAFCVFGMTEPIARKAAAKAWDKHLATMTKEVRACLTYKDEADWIAVKTEYLLAKAKPVQVSGAFDAPQFAHGYIALAKRMHRTSRLKVMVRGEKKDANGAPIISAATKRPVIGWVPYSI